MSRRMSASGRIFIKKTLKIQLVFWLAQERTSVHKSNHTKKQCFSETCVSRSHRGNYLACTTTPRNTPRSKKILLEALKVPSGLWGGDRPVVTEHLACSPTELLLDTHLLLLLPGSFPRLRLPGSFLPPPELVLDTLHGLLLLSHVLLVVEFLLDGSPDSLPVLSHAPRSGEVGG